MSVYVGGSKYPDCFGHFQGTLLGLAGDCMGGEPITSCRKCAPFRKCREETIQLYRKKHKIKSGHLTCVGLYDGPQQRCRGCAWENYCRRRTAKMEHIAEVKHEKIEEDSLVARLKKKVRDKWGGS